VETGLPAWDLVRDLDMRIGVGAEVR